MTITQRSTSAQWSSTIGLNLIRNFKPGNKFRAPGKARDRDGKPVENEFTMVSLHEVKSNRYFGAVKVKTVLGYEVELHIPASNRYTVPVNQR